MKLLLYVLVFTGCFLPKGNAQRDCAVIIAEIHQLTSVNKFAEVQLLWESANSCKVANDTIFSDWEKVLEYAITHSKEKEQQANIDRLFALYKSYDANFPSNNKGLNVRKALLLNSQKLGSADQIYQLLDVAFKNPDQNAIAAKALAIYFDLFFKQYKAGKEIKEANVFAKRDAVLSRIRELSQSNPAAAREYQSAASGINALVAPITTCDKLISYYNSSFELQKSNALWLQNAAEGLNASHCTGTSFFLSLSETWHKVAQTAASTYNLGTALLQNGNTSQAIEYYKLAAELEPDVKQKAPIYYAIATLVATDKPQAYEYLKKTVAANPAFGKAYLLIAHLYGDAPDCGNTDFEKKAIYFLAAELARKAGDNDPLMKAAAVYQAAQFLKKAPSEAEIKSAKMAGKKITYNCWINESVIVPKS